MPSSYTPPDVVVTQDQRTRSAPRITPPLPVVVVGPSAQIVTRANTGLYGAGDDITRGLPGLATGAIVDEMSLDVLLDAKTSAGSSLGLFRLHKNADYAVVYDANGLPASIKVFGSMGLEYSLLSSRNNNADTISADTSTGTPDGLWFSDNSLDFVSRSVDSSGDCTLIISSPSNLVGRYVIRDLITGVGALATTAHEVRAEQVDTNGVAILRKSWTGINAGTSTKSFTGFCTNHVRGLGFSETNNVSAAVLNGSAETPSSSLFGIGIAQAPIVSMVTADFNAIIAPGLVGGATPALLPGQKSSASVWFTPYAGTPNQGPNAPKWVAIMAAAKVGNWLRVKLAAGTEVRDFKILSVDFKNQQLLLQNPDGDLTDSTTYQPVNNGITEAYILEVMRGSSDAANACGDYVLLDDGVYHEIYRATPYRIDFTAVLSFGASVAAVASRGFAWRNTAASYDLKKAITSGFGGNIYTSFTAARVDLAESGLITISSENDIEKYLGPIHKDNPLALGAAMVNQAGGTAGGRVFFALSTASAGVAGYQDAFDLLQTTEDVYFVVPLSQDKAIHTALAAHVKAMSQPEMKGERIGFICPSFPAPVRVLPPNSTDVPVGGTVDALDPLKMVSLAVDWTLAAVGNLVWVVDNATGTKLSSHRIKSIDIPNSRVTVFNPFPTTGATIHFVVETYTLTTSEEAAAIRDYASSFGSKRMVCMVPDQVKITYTNKTLPVPADETWLLPGYYAAAAFCGYRSNVDPSQPMTNVSIPGIQELVHSNAYFLPDQLNTIAEGGNTILIQRTKSTPCYVRHQLTTNMASIEERELSITVAVDYCAKVMRIGLRPYIGKHNITDELLTQLRGIAESLLRALVEGFVVRQGSTLESLEQNTDRPDEVDLKISLVVFYPCNRINVTLYI